MAMDFNGLIGELYKPTIKRHFENHPDGDGLVEKMFSGEATTEQIDIWFAEAESYTWEKMKPAPPKSGPSEDEKYITIEIIDNSGETK